MRQVLILAAIAVVGGTYAAHFADRSLVDAPPQAAAVQPAPRAQEDASYGRTLTLDADRQGHYEVQARVNGRHIAFMVDSGASLVALRESDAAEAGIRPLPADYTANVSTANGLIKGARARLDRIEIGDITVYDVPALVLPDEALGRNLLGVSFLSRLKRYEVANGRLVMEQ
jgi:aspartyl protease family protein